MKNETNESIRKYGSFKEYLENQHGDIYHATDMLIRHTTPEKNGLIIIKRKNYPWGFAPAGGMLDKGIPLQSNAIKETAEELGLKLNIDDSSFYRPMQLYVPRQDPRAEIIATVYTGEGMGILKAGDDAKSAGVYTPEEIAEMLFLPVGNHERPEQKDVWAAKHHKVMYSLYLLNQKEQFTQPQRLNMEHIVQEYTQEIKSYMSREYRKNKSFDSRDA